MNIQSAINKEVFIPCDERLLVAVEVQRRKRKRMSFLTGPKGDYTTYICVSVTNKKPHQLLITKLKKFKGAPSFVRRTQWTVEQLRQVNGINPNKDSPEFDLVFDNTVDQWVANSSAEKCIFVQILYHACQKYCEGKAVSLEKAGQMGKVQQNPPHPQVGPGPNVSTPPTGSRTLQTQLKSQPSLRQPEFINCQSKLTRDARPMNLAIYRCKALVNRMKKIMVPKQRSARHDQAENYIKGGTMSNIIHRMNLSLGERGDRLSRAEDRTVELMQKASQFADTAHKLALKYSK